jgi:TolB-like protein
MRLSFADYTLDVDRRELCCGSTMVDVEPQVFDLLHYLVQNCDRVVSKDDLIAAVWGGRVVSDSTIASRINAARKALGDSGQAQKLIRTITRKGVRFVGDVRTVTEGEELVHAAGPALNRSQGPVRRAVPPLDRPAIAVLPFANMSGEPEQDYFSDGISEDIITALSKMRWFFVIARNSSFSYRGKSIHLKQIAEELGVGYIVEGSVRKSGERVRIAAQLSETATGSQLWGERYEYRLADMFVVQDEITEAIVAAIEPQLYAAENFHAWRKPPEHLRAWDLAMQALSHFWQLTYTDNLAAQALLEKAIAIDPNYAQALAILSVSHIFGTIMGWEDGAVAVPTAGRAALAASQADSSDPWTHLAMAAVCVLSGRVEDALAEFEIALHLNPNFLLAQGYYGLTLSLVGRRDEGVEAIRRAQRMSPRDPFFAILSAIMGFSEFVGRNYDAAMRAARDAIRQRAGHAGAHRVLVAAAAMAGEIDVAKAALQDLRRAQPNISLAWLASRMPYPCAPEAEREHFLEGFRRIGLE